MSTKLVAFMTVFAALYVVMSILPGVPVVGLPEAKIELEASIASVFGLILGPYLGALTAFMGAFVAWIIPPGSADLYGAPWLLAPPINALVVGLIHKDKWRHAFALFGILIAAFWFTPTSQPLDQYSYVGVAVTWASGVIVAWLLIIPTVMIARTKGSSLKFLPALYFLLAFIGNQADNMWGCDIFAVPIVYEGIFGLNLETTRFLLVVSPFVYLVIRIVQAIIAMVIAVPLIRSLEAAGLIPIKGIIKEKSLAQKSVVKQALSVNGLLHKGRFGNKMMTREGDLIESLDGPIFDVKGMMHLPERVVASIRFVPDPNGDRKRDGITYRKVYALKERYALLERTFPQYLVYDPVFGERLCEVPVEAIEHHYKPTERLQDLLRSNELDEVESQALQLIRLLKKTASVSWSKLGVSGSILVKLHTPTSDIDPIVYGSKSCYKVYLTLKSLRENKESLVRPYELEELKKLFDFRSKDTLMAFEDFVRTESRKALQGKFMGRDYFIRCVKDWDEIEERYGTVRYTPEGYAKIRARVVDDSEAIFTPCCYKIDSVEVLEGVRVEPIEEIVSFRGRFCDQAKNGEMVIAQGKVERVQKEEKRRYYRLLLGNKVSDHMVLV